MEKSHLEQAKRWLQAAEYLAITPPDNQEKWSVAVAMLVHAIIKANDALTTKYLNSTPRRHDEARRLFEDIKRKNLIKAEHASYDQIIQDAINTKAKAEYRIAFFSKNDYEHLQRKAKRFLAMVEFYL